MIRLLVIVMSLAFVGCQGVKESLYSPLTARLDLANSQLAAGIPQVELGNAKLDALDAKLTQTNQQVARIEKQLVDTDTRLKGMEAELKTATKAVTRVGATASEMNTTVREVAGTLGTTQKRIEVMDGRLGEANKKVDEVNKKMDVIVDAAEKGSRGGTEKGVRFPRTRPSGGSRRGPFGLNDSAPAPFSD